MSGAAVPRILAIVPAGLAGVADPLSSVRAACALAGGAHRVCAVVVEPPQTDPTAPHAPWRMALDAGADEVWRVTHPGLGPAPDADALVAVLAEALQAPSAEPIDARSLVLLPAGGGEEVAARLALHFDAAPLGRCARIALGPDGLRASREAYGGRARVDVVSEQGPWCATMRAAPPTAGVLPIAVAEAPSIEADALPPGPRMRTLACTGPLPPDRVQVRADSGAGPRMPALEGARVVVSGGRGIGGAEGFVLLEQLADALGGALGGSLPAVDSGWLPVARQVGQSGTFVTPELYVAVGISGTPQHMAGVGPDTRIFAVNDDPQADIFRVAEVGVVADWKALLPALLASLHAQDPPPEDE
jgi:electron transfer flavoprotein alpha subunit